MSSHPEDRDFLAFRASGDPADLARVFDATAPQLLAVAVHLTRDQHAAEDIVQSTFLAAIQSAPSYDPSTRVRTWLLGILANRAHYLRRQTRRRPDPQRLRGGTAADPVRAASERELEAAFESALDTLPDAYAPVLDLHVAHGLNAKEIARALRRPPGTVRTQIVRGMELLRRALPAGFATGSLLATASSGAAQHGLAAVKHVVLTQAAAAAPAFVGATVLSGGVVAMKKMWIGVAVLCVAILGWFVMPDAETARPSQTEEKARPLTADSPRRDEQAPADTSPAETRQAVTNSRNERTGPSSVRLQLVWSDDGAPIPRQSVSNFRIINRRYVFQSHGKTDDQGHVTFRDLAPARYEFYTPGGRLNASVAAGDQLDEKLVVKVTAVISGVVVDARGRRLAGARIEFERNAGDPRLLATSAADGSFRAKVAKPGNVWARKPHYQPSNMEPVTTSREDVELMLPDGGHRVAGLVLDPLGRAVAGAKVAITVDESIRSQKPPIVVRTGASGQFHSVEVPLGKRAVYAFRDGLAHGHARVDVVEGGVTDIVVRLRAGATVFGTARGDDGEPVPNLHVQAFRENRFPGLRVGVADAITRVETRTDAGGRFRLRGVPPGHNWLAAMFESNLRMKPRSEGVQLEDGQELEWNPSAVPPGKHEIRGVLVGPDGKGLEGFEVHTTYLNLVSMENETAEAKSDAEGRFVLRGLRDAEYRLIVYVPGTKRRMSMALREGVRPGTEELVWKIPYRVEDFGSITGRLLDATGKPNSRARFFARMDGITRSKRKVSDGDGSFRIDDVPPGTWRIEGRLEGYGSFAVGEHTVTAKATCDIGVIRLAPRGRALVRLRGTKSGKANLSARGVPHGYNKVRNFTARGDGYASPELPPGRYELFAFGDDFAPIRREIEIAPGETNDVELRVTPVPVVVFTFELERFTDTGNRVFAPLAILDGSGRTVLDRTVTLTGKNGRRWSMGLPPGSYSLTAKSFTTGFRQGSVRFDVPVDADKPVAVRIRLSLQK